MMNYKIFRGDDLILESQETREFAVFFETDDADQPRIRAIPIPPLHFGFVPLAELTRRCICRIIT